MFPITAHGRNIFLTRCLPAPSLAPPETQRWLHPVLLRLLFPRFWSCQFPAPGALLGAPVLFATASPAVSHPLMSHQKGLEQSRGGACIFFQPQPNLCNLAASSVRMRSEGGSASPMTRSSKIRLCLRPDSLSCGFVSFCG